MVADTYDSLLGLLEMGTGNQNNSWGASFNASVTTPLGRAIAGVVTRGNTGGTLDLSGSPPPAGLRQDVDAIQIFNGTLSAHQTVIVPNLSKAWLFMNSTTGNFNLYVKTTAGAVTLIPQGTTKHVYCDGNNNVFRLDKETIGTIFHHGGTVAPAGSFACSGTSLLRADHPELFAAIGTTWGAADGTHFTLPLFTDTNRYLRSSGGAIAVGTYQANQNKVHTHTGSGTTSQESVSWTHSYSGTTSTESVTHNHSYNNSNGASGGVTGGGSFGLPTLDTAGTTGNQSANHTHTYSGTTSSQSVNHTHTYSFTTSNGSADGSEARPESAAVLICIKY